MVNNYFSEILQTHGEVEERKTVITLDDAINLVVKRLNEQKNLKRFSEDHSLCYTNIIAIKNKKGKRYPLLIQKLLAILYDIDTEYVHIFEIKDKKDET